MKKIIAFLLLALSLTLPSFASGSQDVKEWTAYIHMNGDNNLCSYARKDIAELKMIDATANANIIVAFDCSNRNDSQLLEIQGQNVKVLDSGREYDMGSWEFFAKTASEVFTKFPSKKRMAVLWNHGSGWKNKLMMMSLTEEFELDKGISYDDDSGNHMTTPQLAQALEIITQDQKLDIFAFDACLMQMIEVGYEVSHLNLDLIVASEETEPADGWNYTGVAKGLSLGLSSIDQAKTIVDSYISYYGNRAVTQSVVDVKALIPLTESFADFVKFSDNLSDVKSAMNKATSFYTRSYKDIGSFLSYLPESNEVLMLKDFYNKAVVYSRAGINGASGLSIYMTPYPSSGYRDLRFNQATGWFDLISKLK